MAELFPIRNKILSNQPINQSINQSSCFPKRDLLHKQVTLKLHKVNHDRTHMTEIR